MKDHISKLMYTLPQALPRPIFFQQIMKYMKIFWTSMETMKNIPKQADENKISWDALEKRVEVSQGKNAYDSGPCSLKSASFWVVAGGGVPFLIGLPHYYTTMQL